MIQSIQSRLALFLVFCTSVFLSVGGWFVYEQTKTSFYREFDERLRLQALSLTTGVKQEREYVDVAFSDRYLREYDDDSPSWFFQIWSPLPVNDRDRPKTMRSDSLQGGENLPKRFGSLEEPVYWNFQLPDGRPGRGIGLRYVPHADRHDRKRNFDATLNVELVVAQDRTELDRSLHAVAKNLCIAGGVGMLATVLVVPAILRRLLRPLRVVSKQAEAIRADTLNTRIDADVPPEIRPVCAALNGLLDRVEKAFERERQFSSDIAHELRTPVAELKSYAELKIKWPNKTEGCFEREVLEMALRMESLVENLLSLARMERSGLANDRGDTVVLDLVNESVAAFRGAARSRGIEMECDVPASLTLYTHRELFRTIVVNLISNAVFHAPPGDRVHVGVRDNPFCLTVRNRAPHLKEGDLTRMFDRLWRHDDSRSHSGHHGLGLSLAQTCAEALGMKLSASLDEQGNLSMLLEELPVTETAKEREC